MGINTEKTESFEEMAKEMDTAPVAEDTTDEVVEDTTEKVVDNDNETPAE